MIYLKYTQVRLGACVAVTRRAFDASFPALGGAQKNANTHFGLEIGRRFRKDVLHSMHAIACPSHPSPVSSQRPSSVRLVCAGSHAWHASLGTLLRRQLWQCIHHSASISTQDISRSPRSEPAKLCRPGSGRSTDGRILRMRGRAGKNPGTLETVPWHCKVRYFTRSPGGVTFKMLSRVWRSENRSSSTHPACFTYRSACFTRTARTDDPCFSLLFPTLPITYILLVPIIYCILCWKFISYWHRLRVCLLFASSPVFQLLLS